ncbi:MAG: uL30 family ribosomal protein [Candidatus Nanohaloarchaea archaeon]
MIAAVKVRGSVDAPHTIEDTMQNLGLENRNQIVFYEENDSIKGMMNKAKDFITYGEVSDDIIEEVEERYEEVESGTVIDARPPSKGFRNTKKGVNQSGSLGKRDSIDSLLKRMI